MQNIELVLRQYMYYLNKYRMLPFHENNNMLVIIKLFMNNSL